MAVRQLLIAIYWSTSNTSTSTSTLTTSTSTKYISDNGNILTHPFDFDHVWDGGREPPRDLVLVA